MPAPRYGEKILSGDAAERGSVSDAEPEKAGEVLICADKRESVRDPAPRKPAAISVWPGTEMTPVNVPAVEKLALAADNRVGAADKEPVPRNAATSGLAKLAAAAYLPEPRYRVGSTAAIIDHGTESDPAPAKAADNCVGNATAVKVPDPRYLAKARIAMAGVAVRAPEPRRPAEMNLDLTTASPVKVPEPGNVIAIFCKTVNDLGRSVPDPTKLAADGARTAERLAAREPPVPTNLADIGVVKASNDANPAGTVPVHDPGSKKPINASPLVPRIAPGTTGCESIVKS
jgi:hypothetical protein